MYRTRSHSVCISFLFHPEPKSCGPVVCLSPKVATWYRAGQPRQSPLYQLIQRYYPEFERTYDKNYQQRYGLWRPVIGDVVRKFLRCGDLHFGFAGAQCTGCPHEMFVPFSCQQRCLCPSCHQKRSLLLAERMATSICQPVPHRQIAWTIPQAAAGLLPLEPAYSGRIGPRRMGGDP